MPNRRYALTVCASGLVKVDVDPVEDYGFRFTNNSDRDLYPHVLDNSELSIGE